MNLLTPEMHDVFISLQYRAKRALSKSDKLNFPFIASTSSVGLVSKVILLPMRGSATNFRTSRLVSYQ